MSGTSILRREGALASVGGVRSQSKRLARRSAFEANLALQLEKALGGDASLSDVEALTRILGAAYHEMTHIVDARTSIAFGLKRYVVLQAGWSPTTGDYRLDTLDPFASKLLSYLPAKAMEEIEPRIKAVGAALGKAEISRRHPTDFRLRLNTPWVRLYFNFLSGRDKRDRVIEVSHDRRKPVNDSIGLMVLMVIAAALSVLGAGLIASTAWALSKLMMHQIGRETLAAMFGSSITSLKTFLTGIGWV